MPTPTPDYSEPLPTELEQIYDECRADAGLPPAMRSADAGVADMLARIEYHTMLIKKFTAPGRVQTPAVGTALAECRQNLAEALAYWKDYEGLRGRGN